MKNPTPEDYAAQIELQTKALDRIADGLERDGQTWEATLLRASSDAILEACIRLNEAAGSEDGGDAS